MEADASMTDGHLCNMGRMIEEMESKMRNGLDQVYFGKTKEVVFTLREPLGVLNASSHSGQSLQQCIINEIGRF
jgi:capping protein beta